MKQLIAVLLVGCALVCFSPVNGFTGETEKGATETPGSESTAPSAATDDVLTEEDLSDDEDLFAEYDTEGEDTQMVADPLYYFNYAMFSVNDVLYFYALKPVAQGYKAVVPTVARKGISNFFNNLMFPIRFANNILQGKGDRAVNEVGAFVVNTTVGVLGFYDFAQRHMDMDLPDEDLGQTLGVYGIGDGFYLVLPLLGPSTLRDTVGRVGDSFANPLNYVEPWELAWGLEGLDQVNKISFRIGDYEALKEASLDPYVALRNAYIQNRKSLIRE
ncbi:MAG: VacJ family lipoprotein [Desulfobacterales bacterium]|nr:VacJ family lipoprotein [Desulfobacterales bacterium]